MLLPRACLILCFAASLVIAAPAPFARTKRPTPSHGWSEPVAGVRVRLVPGKNQYRVGEKLELTLEIQNVSGSSLAIEDPILYPIVGTSQSHVPGWSLSSKRIDSHRRRGAMIDLIESARSDTRKFAAGATLQIELLLSTDALMEKKRKELETDELRQEELGFRDADTPGEYEFRITYRSSEGKRKREAGWDGDGLLSPPVRIELVK